MCTMTPVARSRVIGAKQFLLIASCSGAQLARLFFYTLYAQALQLLNMLKARRNCPTNVHSYTPLVEALTRDLRWQEAIMLFQEMENSKITPTVESYTSVVRA